MLKTAGFLLLLFFCYGCGSALLEREKAERQTLEELLLILSKTEEQILGKGLALTEIYPTLQGKQLEKCGFLPKLRESGSWQSTLCSSEMPDLGEDCKAALTHFAEEVGKNSREGELARIETLRSVLQTESKKRKEAAPGRAKLIRTLTLSFGGLVGLLLL